MRIGAFVQLVGAALVLVLSSVPAIAATQIVGGGVLTGATGVNVDGKLYNVSFVDGTCISVFGGCDSDSDFVIPKANTFDAAQALLDQVFTGEFDIAPNLTAGCDLPEICFVMVPTHLETAAEFQPGTVFLGIAENCDASECTDSVASEFRATNLGTDRGGEVWAKFSSAAVPEPSTWAMMLIGFGAVGAAARRRKNAALPRLGRTCAMRA
jgi:PEP-CTERM motif